MKSHNTSDLKNMIRIQFICDGKQYPFHWLQHASVLITDMQTNKSFLINHLPSNWKKVAAPLAKAGFDHFEKSCVNDIVTLYCKDSRKNIKEFSKLYSKKFSNKKFNIFTNNCSDAANFAIEYFFPDVAKREFCIAYDALCCLLCVGTLGLKCFSPSCMSLPIDSFDRVKELEKNYGLSDEHTPLRQLMA